MLVGAYLARIIVVAVVEVGQLVRDLIFYIVWAGFVSEVDGVFVFDAELQRADIAKFKRKNAVGNLTVDIDGIEVIDDALYPLAAIGDGFFRAGKGFAVRLELTAFGPENFVKTTLVNFGCKYFS